MTRFAQTAICMVVALAAPVAVAQDETQQAKIERLVRELGADAPETRDKAQRELEQLGAPAVPALEKATQSEDPEVALRASESLELIRGGRGRTQPQPQRDETRRPPLGNAPQPMPVPDMNELMRESLKQLQEQMPPEFREMFELFNELPGRDQDPGAQRDEERNGADRPRVRVWSWSNGQPNQPRSLGGSEVEQQLGLRSGRTSAALRAQLGIEGTEGLVLNMLVPGGYAEAHGLQRYDVIVALDGRAVRAGRDLAPLLRDGGKVQLYRKAQLQTLELPAAGTAEAQPQQQAPQPEASPKQKGERSF